MEKVREIAPYKRLLTKDLWKSLDSEEKARELVWELKLGKAGFRCESCTHTKYWEHRSRAEVRECSSCHKQHRVRTGTIFEHSKLPLLSWLQAISYVMQDKRGVSALQLGRFLGLKSMATCWLMLMKIRKALMDRDAIYKIQGQIELDGAFFTKDKQSERENPHRINNKTPVIIAVETKQWINEKGKRRSRAGFAKVLVDRDGMETKTAAEKMLTQHIKARSTLKTDGRNSYKNLKGVRTQQKSLTGNKELTNAHLGWVHKFISNAKTWLLGTHHGRIAPKYLHFYLAEYTYRFNRRHDPNSLFHRALSACILSRPITQPALTG